MSLVSAPASWESRLCMTQCVDNGRIRDADGLPIDNYADPYIGDYVKRLADFVESYRIDYPFHQGADVAVISLRDQIHGVRAMCRAPTPNILASSGTLEASAWQRSDCEEGIDNCIGVWKEAAGFPSEFPDRQVAGLSGYRIVFGPHDRDECDPDLAPMTRPVGCVCNPSTDG
jgi:hypothetical protein